MARIKRTTPSNKGGKAPRRFCGGKRSRSSSEGKKNICMLPGSPPEIGSQRNAVLW